MPISQSLILPFVSAGSAMLVACIQDGGCREASRTLITDPSALVLMGTFADVRATVAGTRSGTLQWHDSSPHVRGFPPPGSTGISVTIVEPAEAWDVDLERYNVPRNERLACPDFLETDLEIELRSDDGMLDATIVVPVDFMAPDSVVVWADITDEDLGMLRWDPVEEDAQLFLVLEYGTLTGPEGSLRYSFEHSDGFGHGVGFMTNLATWTLPNVEPERPK